MTATAAGDATLVGPDLCLLPLLGSSKVAGKLFSPSITCERIRNA